MTRLLRMLIHWLVIKPFVNLGFGLSVRGREVLDREGPFVLVSNHNSHLDLIFLLSLFSPTRLHHIRPIGAADYFGRNALTRILTSLIFNALLIQRERKEGEPGALEVMGSELEAGRSLIVFPEGTRGAPEQLGRIRSGASVLLKSHPEARLVMVAMSGLGRSMPKGSFYPVPFICKVTIEEAEQRPDEVAETTALVQGFFTRVLEAEKRENDGW